MTHTPSPLLLSVLLDDDDTCLDRVVSLLRRRRVPIDSLSMRRGIAPGTTWLSLALRVSGLSPHRIREELRKLISVRNVQTIAPQLEITVAPSTSAAVPRQGGTPTSTTI